MLDEHIDAVQLHAIGKGSRGHQVQVGFRGLLGNKGHQVEFLKAGALHGFEEADLNP